MMAESKAFEILGYSIAQYHDGKSKAVIFNYMHQSTGARIRVKIEVGRIEKRNERERFARELTTKINSLLRSGWRPLGG